MIPALVCALMLFFSFKNRKSGNSQLVNFIASCVFGVYLLHDNPNIRGFIWQKWFANAEYINSATFIIRISISVLLVFTVGIYIEFVRKVITEKITHKVKLKS